MPQLPEYHVLDFNCDEQNASALTILSGGAWYHVIADPRRLQDQSKAGRSIRKTYSRLLAQMKAVETGKTGKSTAPLFVKEDEENSDPGGDRDSAVDVSTPISKRDEAIEHEREPQGMLQRWMLAPLAKILYESAAKDQARKQSVQDWYHCARFFFELFVQDGRLRAKEDESPSSSLEKRLERLVPSMSLPKYIRKLEIPSIAAEDLTVLKESSEPAPTHPTRVQHKDGKEYFLKLVDPTQYQSTKREIQVMARIESEGLHNELRVPLLRGLVYFSTCSQNNIIGFIMDAIEDPTPLTLLIDGDVSEEKRLTWSEESARMVDILHQHGIIWGDAKGDNFLVDANDDLWIIDFGGSYTEGWVDPELNETEEGDGMGVRKLRNGLEDPENNTIQEDGERELQSKTTREKAVDEAEERVSQRETDNMKQNNAGQLEMHSGVKRKVEDDDDGEGDLETQAPRKGQKNEHNQNNDEPLYCYCNEPGQGKMVACDGNNCNKQWFHFDCVGLEEPPEEKQWYCYECRRA